MCKVNSPVCTALCALSAALSRAEGSGRRQIERRLGRLKSAIHRAGPCRRDRTPPWQAAVVLGLSAPAGAKLRQGAYLLRTNLDPMDPNALWRQHVQLTQVEAAFQP